MSKARLTYRLDGDRRRTGEKRPDGPEKKTADAQQKVIPLYEDEFHVVSEPPQAGTFQTDYGVWESPFDAETQRIEQMIRATNAGKFGDMTVEEPDEPEEPVKKPSLDLTPDERDWILANRESRSSRHDHRIDEPDRLEESFRSEQFGWADRPARDSGRTDTGSNSLRPEDNGWTDRNNFSERGSRSEREGRYVPDNRYGFDRRSAGTNMEYPYEEDRRYRDSEDHSPLWEEDVRMTARTVRHARSSWPKIAASLVGAVATGGLLGYLVLSMIDSNSGSAGKADINTAISSPAPGVKSGSKDTSTAGTTAKEDAAAMASVSQAGTIAAVIPARTYTFLQNGTFSTAQSADSAAADLRKKGVAAVTEQGDKFYVYVGVSGNKDNAKALGTQLQAKKIDIYAKSVTLPAASRIKWQGKPEGLQSYLTQTDQLVQMMSGLTLIHLEEAKPTPLDDATIQALKKAHDTWSGSVSGVNEAAPPEAKLALQKMNNGINTAKQSLDDYKKTPTADLLWQVQNSLTQCLLAEKDLLTTVSAS